VAIKDEPGLGGRDADDSAGWAVRKIAAARETLPVSTILTKLLSFLKSTLMVPDFVS
jgi:hypothetical protein